MSLTKIALKRERDSFKVAWERLKAEVERLEDKVASLRKQYDNAVIQHNGEIEGLKNTIRDYISDADQDTTMAAICRAMTGCDELEVDWLKAKVERLQEELIVKKGQVNLIRSVLMMEPEEIEAAEAGGDDAN